MAHERLEHRELAGGQVDRLPGDHRLARADVERDPAGLEHGRLGRAIVPQLDPHPGLGRHPGLLGLDHPVVELDGPLARHLQPAQHLLVGADHIAQGDRPLHQVA